VGVPRGGYTTEAAGRDQNASAGIVIKTAAPDWIFAK